MNKFMEWFTRKKFLISALVLSIVFVFFYTNSAYYSFCDGNYLNESCGSLVKFIKLLFYVFPAIFLFSVISFFVSDKAFFSWRKFTVVFFLIYLAILIVTPWYLGDAFLNLQKAHISYLGLFVYSLISLILIVYKSLKKE